VDKERTGVLFQSRCPRGTTDDMLIERQRCWD
jgi:hypothetical protein